MTQEWYGSLDSITGEARQMARNIFTAGVHPVEAARKYVADFDKVSASRRRLVYALLAMTCFADARASRKLSMKAGIRNNRGYTWSEIAYRVFFEESIEQYVFDKQEPLTLRTLCSGLGSGINEEGTLLAAGRQFPNFVNPAQRECLLELGIKGHLVFGCRRRNGHLALIYVLPENDCVLIDEEVFSGEHPLYFTESSHYPSPVCILHTLHEIFRYAIAKTNFAPIHPDLFLVLPSPKGKLINVEDYQPSLTTAGHPDWKEIELRMRGGSRSRRLFNDLVPLAGKKDDTIDWYIHDYMVLRLFNSTATLFNHLPQGRFHSNLSPKVLDPISHIAYL